jgi:RNA polymerase sigma factor (sigma-70 family)
VAAAGATTADLATKQAVRDAIGQLSARQRAVVVLRYYQDLTDEQIASVLGWPVGSVESLLHRAAATLRQHLEQEE